MYYIYVLLDPRSHAIRFVGISSDPERRYIEHVNNRDGTNIQKAQWIDVLHSLGLEPHIRLIDECKTRREALDVEYFWIAYFTRRGASLLNLSSVSITKEIHERGLRHLYDPDSWDAPSSIERIALCVAQGRYQDISIKDLARLELMQLYREETRVLLRTLRRDPDDAREELQEIKHRIAVF